MSIGWNIDFQRNITLPNKRTIPKGEVYQPFGCIACCHFFDPLKRSLFFPSLIPKEIPAVITSEENITGTVSPSAPKRLGGFSKNKLFCWGPKGNQRPLLYGKFRPRSKMKVFLKPLLQVGDVFMIRNVKLIMGTSCFKMYWYFSSQSGADSNEKKKKESRLGTLRVRWMPFRKVLKQIIRLLPFLQQKLLPEHPHHLMPLVIGLGLTIPFLSCNSSKPS